MFGPSLFGPVGFQPVTINGQSWSSGQLLHLGVSRAFGMKITHITLLKHKKHHIHYVKYIRFFSLYQYMFDKIWLVVSNMTFIFHFIYGMSSDSQ